MLDQHHHQYYSYQTFIITPITIPKTDQRVESTLVTHHITHRKQQLLTFITFLPTCKSTTNPLPQTPLSVPHTRSRLTHKTSSRSLRPRNTPPTNTRWSTPTRGPRGRLVRQFSARVGWRNPFY